MKGTQRDLRLAPGYTQIMAESPCPVHVFLDVWSPTSRNLRRMLLLEISGEQQLARAGQPIAESELLLWTVAVVGQAGVLDKEVEAVESTGSRRFRFVPEGDAEYAGKSSSVSCAAFVIPFAARKVLRSIVPTTELSRVPSASSSTGGSGSPAASDAEAPVSSSVSSHAKSPIHGH
jgi:hypothetical protein